MRPIALYWIALVLTTTARAQCADFAPSFSPSGVLGRVDELAAFDDGSGEQLYAAGSFTAAGELACSNVARWNGSTWSPVGAGFSAVSFAVGLTGMTAYDDGSGSKLYVSGGIGLTGVVNSLGIVRWDGASWAAVGANTPVTAYSLAHGDLGSGEALFAGGYAFNAPAVRRWDGATWSTFGTNLSAGRVDSMAIYGAQLFIAGSNSQQVYRGSGGAWTLASTGITGAVSHLEVLDVGAGPTLYAGGSGRVWTWNGASWTTIGTLPDLLVRDMAVLDTGAGPQLHVFGYDGLITSINPPIDVVWRLDGVTWTRVGSSTTSTGSALTVASFDSGAGEEIYVGGSFGRLQGGSAQSIAKWNGAEFVALQEGRGLVASSFTPTARAFASYTPPGAARPWSIVGGNFIRAGGAPASNVAAWTGSEWRALGDGVGDDANTVYALATYQEPGASSPALFAGGDFAVAGGVNAYGIARWDGTAWSRVGGPPGGVGGKCRALLVHDDGSGAGPCLFVGGNFSLVNGNVAAANIARWNGTTWSAVGQALNSTVHALVLYDDPNIPGPAQLYAVGAFTASGATPIPRVARWDGVAWNDVGFPDPATPTHAVVWDAGQGPELFTGALTAAPMRFDGATWIPLWPPVEGPPLAVFDDGAGERLYYLRGIWDGAAATLFDSKGAGYGAALDEGDGHSALWFSSFGVSGSSIHAGVARYSNPCAVLATYCTALVNSRGCTPSIGSLGTPSTSSGAPCSITASQVVKQKNGLLFYGLAGRSNAPFQGGVLCVHPPTRRTPVQFSGGASGPDDCSGAYSFDFNAWMNAAVDPYLTAGVRVDCQYWSRDPAAPTLTGLTNALEFEIGP